MPAILSIDQLEKNYGKIKAVNKLSLEVSEGSVYGLLGPNGSGKTTTLGIVLDVLKNRGGATNGLEKLRIRKVENE